MIIYGTDYHFAMTVGAQAEISKICPGNSLKRVEEIFSAEDNAVQLGAAVELLCALSRGYESKRKFEEPGYTPNPLTPELVYSLDLPTLLELQQAALVEARGDYAGMVNIEPAKKKGPEGPTLS